MKALDSESVWEVAGQIKEFFVDNKPGQLSPIVNGVDSETRF